MFLLCANRDNLVGYYKFPESSKLLFSFFFFEMKMKYFLTNSEMYSEFIPKCLSDQYMRELSKQSGLQVIADGNINS